MASLPAGWSTGVDPSGRTFYQNAETKKTQWEFPQGIRPDAPPPYQDEAKPIMATAVLQGVGSVPVTQQAPTVIVMEGGTVGGIAPRGAPPGGQWIQEKHCGVITWLVGLFIFPCVCCCPCDARTVYIVNGVRYNTLGALIQNDCC